MDFRRLCTAMVGGMAIAVAIALVFGAACLQACSVAGDTRQARQGDWHGVAELTADICYCSDGAAYPNAYFDLYQPQEHWERPRPVFVYVHGGGYVGGSKNTQDASCMGPGAEALFEQLLRRGCSVVSMDYALAPDARYPVPVLQVALLMGHLRAHAQKYGIDMQRVALGGGSAGGQIAGQYAAALTDAGYAGELLAHLGREGNASDASGEVIERELRNGRVAAVYLGCALLDPAQFARTGDAATDEKFSAMQAAYFGTGQSGEQTDGWLREANVIEHATAEFPPAYVTDGNYLTFDEQAREFDERLTELGVEHVARIAQAGEGAVPHGYDVQGGEDARRNAEAAAEFVCRELGDE